MVTIFKQEEIENKRHCLMDKVSASLFHSEHSTFSFTKILKDGLSLKHTHPFEQTNLVLEGTLELDLNGETVIVRKGDLIMIPSDELHQYRASTDSLMLEVLQPKLTPEIMQKLHKQAEMMSKQVNQE